MQSAAKVVASRTPSQARAVAGGRHRRSPKLDRTSGGQDAERLRQLRRRVRLLKDLGSCVRTRSSIGPPLRTWLKSQGWPRGYSHVGGRLRAAFPEEEAVRRRQRSRLRPPYGYCSGAIAGTPTGSVRGRPPFFRTMRWRPACRYPRGQPPDGRNQSWWP